MNDEVIGRRCKLRCLFVVVQHHAKSLSVRVSSCGFESRHRGGIEKGKVMAPRWCKCSEKSLN